MAAALAEIDEEEFEERYEYLTVLTKSANYQTREHAEDQLAELNRLAAAGLVKAGPKGYIHGWIFVGPQAAGARVFHPEHGHGTVTRTGKRSVGVQFDRGHHASFQHNPETRTPEHFAERGGRGAVPKPAAVSPVHEHLANAHTALREGRHEDALNHMANAVAASSGDKHVQRKIKAMQRDLTGDDPAARRAIAKQLVLRMAAGEKFSADPDVVPHLMDELSGGDSVNMALMQLKGRGNENLFQHHMRDIPRDQMPALPDNVHDLQPFMDALVDRKIKFELVHMNPKEIKATQSQLSGPKVAKLYGFMKSGGWKPGGAMIVSQENALLDGHHRWAGAAMASVAHELGVPDSKPVNVMALKVDLPIDELLKLGEEFSGPKKALTEAP